MEKMAEKPELYVSIGTFILVTLISLVIFIFVPDSLKHIVGFLLGSLFGLLMFFSLCRSFTNSLKQGSTNVELKIRAGYSFRLFSKIAFLLLVAIFIREYLIGAAAGLVVPQAVIYLNQLIIFMKGLKS